MIKVFSGDWRGLGTEEKGLFLMMDFRFRNIMCHFYGAKLAVFMSIILHSDKQGLSFPSYDLLKKETNYSRQTIAKALNDLCALTIDCQRVLMRYRVRDEKGLFTGSNRYLIFPTEDEVRQFEETESSPPSKILTVDNRSGGEDSPQSNIMTLDDGVHSQVFPPSSNLTISINHPLSINQLIKNTLEKETANLPHNEQIGEKGSFIQGGVLDLSEYPSDLRAFLVEFHRLWQVIPPTKKANVSRYKLWIRDAIAVRTACGEFGADLLERYYQKWVKEGKKLTIARLGSLTNLLTAEAGLARQERNQSGGYQPRSTEECDPEEVASFRKKLAEIKEKQNTSQQHQPANV